MRIFFALALVLIGWPVVHATPILVNGDFENSPILATGQTGVSIGGSKWISTTPSGPGYSTAIAGIDGWTYRTPFASGTHSDHGIARTNSSFGLPSTGQSVFINNWDRLISQTLIAPGDVGYTLAATIDFGTLGSATDGGRAGRFYLVAGEANPFNRDEFTPRSIVLDEISVGNPTWSLFTPDLLVSNGLYIPLTLSYTYLPGDPALGLPVTVAFRTVTSSVGPTYWDNASLTVLAVPEPNSMIIFGTLLFVLAFTHRGRTHRST